MKRLCANCKREHDLPSIRCGACKNWFQRYGVERPLDMPFVEHKRLAPRPCGHCGELVTRLLHGMCRSCYQYEARTGEKRPKHLWGNKNNVAHPDRGRCDPELCDNIPTETRSLQVNGSRVELRLCPGCARLFDDMLERERGNR